MLLIKQAYLTRDIGEMAWVRFFFATICVLYTGKGTNNFQGTKVY